MSKNSESTQLERLQKVLARAGIASRRNAEKMILEGHVMVNGKVVTELGTKVNAQNDKIKVHGKLIYTEVEPLFLAFYKPKAVISALSDPEGRPTITDYLKQLPSRVIPIGRMDYNTEGIILLTNDGDLAEKILKSREINKTYMIKVKGHPTEESLAFLKKGVFTRDGVLRFADFGVDAKLKNKSWLKVVVSEGAKLDIKEIFNRRGLMVDRIVRTHVGHLTIEHLAAGEYEFLRKKDFERLLLPPAKTATPKSKRPARK